MASKTFVIGKFEIRFHWFIAFCVVLTIAGLVRLGVWQLHRAAEKTRLQQNVELKQQAGAVAVESLSLAGLETDVLQLQNVQVQLQGEYLNSKTLFLIYQPFQDQIGYEIVTPFKLSTSDLFVLVSRGWTPAASYDALVKNLPKITGRQTLTGQVFVPTKAMADKTNGLEDINWPLVLRFINTLELAPFFEKPLFPYVVRLNEGQEGLLVRHWPTVMVDTGRNQSYALQWFAMAIAVAVVTLILSSNLLTLLKEKQKPS